jgi:hypothetical protein
MMPIDVPPRTPLTVRSPSDIVKTKVYPEAEDFIEELGLDFVSRLLIQAKLVARKRGDDLVLRSHVQEALDLFKQDKKQKGWRVWVVVLGGVLFGTGARGFITEIQSTRSPLILSIYVVLALVGILMVMGPQR